MGSFKLILVNVPHGKSELVSSAAVQAGSFGGTVAMGRGISPNSLLSALGFGDSTRDIVIILATEKDYRPIFGSVVASCRKERKAFGHILALDADGMAKSGVAFGTERTGGDNMEHAQEAAGQGTLSLITVVLNKGYADDAMAAARKAGAGGGTVINARGTAREDDAKFFGVHIVPEKEMLMIVVPQEKRAAVLSAIQDLPCLSEPGSGIAFSAAVSDFTQLGRTSPSDSES
ncbi:MAG: transcriptional regulator [Treponema sp.]|nr:transcriptional regulator [Treponema sp.]MBQ7167427.1 transcriptional regulator [Treponema sp.]